MTRPADFDPATYTLMDGEMWCRDPQVGPMCPTFAAALPPGHDEYLATAAGRAEVERARDERRHPPVRMDGPNGRYALVFGADGCDMHLLTEGDPVDSRDGWAFARPADAYAAIVGWLRHGELPSLDDDDLGGNL